jgi:hypothetical protein
MDPKMICETHNTPAPVPTHASFPSIGVVIFHFKIVSRIMAEDHQSITANAKSSVAHGRNLVLTEFWHFLPAIQQDEIVSGSLIFIKMQFHGF